jgi:UDP-N-acetylmuramyl pentapeptide phosphotransferase/UDP-N-acetylglucosamine-1-phosphate transferase
MDRNVAARDTHGSGRSADHRHAHHTIQPGWILGTVFLMAVIFVTVGIAVAPSRRDSVARIAIGVVMVAATIPAGLGALNMSPWPVLFGACMLAGGIAAYLPWRVRLRSRSA